MATHQITKGVTSYPVDICPTTVSHARRSGHWTQVFHGERSNLAGETISFRDTPSVPSITWYVPPGAELTEAGVNLNIANVPETDDAYIFGFRVQLVDDLAAPIGEIRIGLAYDRAHPNGRAVAAGAWLDDGTRILPASATSAFAPFETHGEPDLWDFPWEPATTYELRIYVGEPGVWWWWCMINGQSANGSFTVPGATLVAAASVEMEVHANCDAPTVEIAWSMPELVEADTGSKSATTHVVTTGTAVYPLDACPDTVSVGDVGRWVQRFNSTRTNLDGDPVEIAEPDATKWGANAAVIIGGTPRTVTSVGVWTGGVLHPIVPS